MSRTASQTRGGEEWSLDDVQHLVLEGVSWELYEHLLKVIGERPLRLTYDNGELEIMSPLPEHEDIKTILGSIVAMLALELDMPMRGLGSTTLRRRLRRKGLEPDECFYFKSQPRVRGKKRLTLPSDPPPDLAIEIDVTARSIPRLPIYAALGVPEVWHFLRFQLQTLQLGRDGEYHSVEKSLTFPMLRPSDLVQFVKIATETGDQTAAVKAFRAWVRSKRWAK